MTTEMRFVVGLCVVCLGCPLDPPPEPAAIDCANIDRAEERFPEECGDAGAAEDAAAPSSDGE